MNEPSRPPDTDPVTAQGRVKPWAALTYRQYRFLWASAGLSVIGEQGRRTVDLWLVYQLSNGSPLQLGLVGLSQALPLFVVGLFSGTVADLVDRKRMLMIATAVRGLLLLILAGLVFAGVVELWHVYAISLVTGLTQAAENPARMSMIPSMIPRTYLMNAIALQATTRQVGMLVGPPLGGFLIGPIGIDGAYVAHAALYGLAVLLMVPLKGGRSAEQRGIRAFRLNQVLEGARFAWQTRFVGGVIGLDAIAVLFTSWRVLMPIFAVDVLGGDEKTMALLMAAPAFGRVVGTTFLLLAGNVKRQGLFVLTVTMGYAVSVALFALSEVFWLSLILMAFVGGTDGAGAITRSTVIQLVVPDDIRGRVTSVSQVFAQGSPALAQMTTGAIAAALGAPGALLLGAGVATAGVVFVATRIRQVTAFRL